MKRYESWGRFPKVNQKVLRLRWPEDGADMTGLTGTVLPFGLGRSYGDSCLNDGGTLLDAEGLDRFIAWDEAAGVVRCQAGVTIGDLLRVAVPRGFFVPVSPGTKYVTIGGAIANDIHGKNHHRDGTFGRHVRQFELLRSDGSHVVCSPSANTALFAATIGGLGLTGLILWAEIGLKRVAGPWMDEETIQFRNVSEFLELTRESDGKFDYTVAWVDSLATGASLGRGIFIRGNHSAAPGDSHENRLPPFRQIPVPVQAPEFLLNRFSIWLFNQAYYHKQFSSCVSRRTHFNPFFYPLDALGNWNLLYGRRGFFQYQCVIPIDRGLDAARALADRVARSGRASFLTVFKTFGNLSSPGLLSFPRPGMTMTFDFANRGEATLKFMDDLDMMVREAGGAVYPAKDARMSAESFQVFFPQWRELERLRDPRFSSSFWRRVSS